MTSKEGAYERFITRLDPHLSRLALLGVDYGLEAVPVSMSLSLEDGEKSTLYANITPTGSYIRGDAKFISTSGEEGEAVPSIDLLKLLGLEKLLQRLIIEVKIYIKQKIFLLISMQVLSRR